ncbi:MAG: GGDEF domain-containing protein [Myxococcota bacterium]|nr:GGDEF domain-containing protein [Myxococcota bacterium]
MAPTRSGSSSTSFDEHTITGGPDTSAALTPLQRRPALLVQRGPTIGDWHLFADTPGPVTVGRGDEATFQIRDASVSRVHATFLVTTEEESESSSVVTVEDEGSTNGTRVNGRTVQQATPLEDGDLIRVGDVVLRFRLMDAADIAFQQDISNQVRNARRDALTGLYSRRYLDEQLPQLVKGHRRNKQPISLLMIDLDHFKRINDEFGHLSGDSLLASVAEAVRGAVRGADSAIRYGGDEFCVILPGTRLHEAQTIAERVRRAIEGLKLDSIQPGMAMTASVGIADLGEREAIHEWLQRADVALFTAKREGGNRTAIGPESVLEGGNLLAPSQQDTVRKAQQQKSTEED